MPWVLMVWSVVATAIVVWMGQAQAVLQGSWTPGKDPDRCAGCRHDRVAHQHADPGTPCSQCPCGGFRAP
jgi:hypothetical protein